MVAKATMNHKLYFKVEKETTGAVRYQECNQAGEEVFDPKVGTFYLRKAALPGKVIDRITITVEG